jgi:hypothetical protein
MPSRGANPTYRLRHPSENLHRVLERDPYAPGQRNADEGPKDGGLLVEPALADSKGTAVCGRGAGALRLQLGHTSGFMNQRSASGLTMRLQTKPRTSIPARMYMVKS